MESFLIHLCRGGNVAEGSTQSEYLSLLKQPCMRSVAAPTRRCSSSPIHTFSSPGKIGEERIIMIMRAQSAYVMQGSMLGPLLGRYEDCSSVMTELGFVHAII